MIESWLPVILAGVVAVAHVFGPAMHARWFEHPVAAQSFGSGMAVAYVFVQLFPELAWGATELGHRVYLLVVVGFVVFFGLSRWSARVHARTVGGRAALRLHLAYMFVYTWLIVYAAPETAATLHPLGVAIACFALAWHLVSGVRGLAERFGDAFTLRHRLVLASAAVLGGVLDVMHTPSELIVSISVALLAGFLMYTALVDELPEPEDAIYPVFALGVAIATGLLELALHV